MKSLLMRVALLAVATRSGKTVYLTALYWSAQHGLLPPGIVGLRPADNLSAGYLGQRLAAIEAGTWPPGTLDTRQITLLVDRKVDVLSIRTADFKGGDFARAFYDGQQEDAQRFIKEVYGECSAYIFLVDPGNIKEASAEGASADDINERERRLGGILPALEALRARSSKMQIFHPPVAIAFTKADRYADVDGDPGGFAFPASAGSTEYPWCGSPVGNQTLAGRTGSLSSGMPPGIPGSHGVW